MKKRLFGALFAVTLLLSFFAMFAVDAHAATDLKASKDCVLMIQGSEGFRAIPYWDYSQWTVGYGTECPAEHLERYKKEGIPVEEANALFMQHLVRFENAVNKFMTKHSLNLTQQQFDALVSFTYNLGTSSLNKTSYTIVDAVLNAETENELIYAFSIYCMAGGEFQPGLMRRRLAEANMFLNGEYSEYAPESYMYVFYDANGGVRDASAQGYDANLAAVPLSRPTRDGYVFVGWYTEPEGGVKITSLDETTAGLTLYAHWEEGVTVPQIPLDPSAWMQVRVVGSAVHVRTGPGMNYGITDTLHAGDVLTITGTTRANGLLWGMFEGGWVCLSHTNYFELVPPGDTVPDGALPVTLPAYATVVSTSGTNIHKGPHSTYPQSGKLTEGTVIYVEEYYCLAGEEWIRCQEGWIRLNSKLFFHDESKLAHNFTATVTEKKVYVRSGAGQDFSKEATLEKDDKVMVYAIVYVDGTPWGRVASGWVDLTATNFDEAKLSQYKDHVFGEWNTIIAATCTTPGQERRNCAYCELSETRETGLGDHVFDAWQVTAEPNCTEAGQEQRSCTLCQQIQVRLIDAPGHSFTPWYETKAPTAEEFGQEQRDCQVCGHSEIRQILPTEHSFGPWEVIQAPTCTEPGLERRQCINCEHTEEREVEATGHHFGQWYESIAPTLDEYGQERRDCENCDHFETRQLDKLPIPTVIRTYAIITTDVLRVRSGPGTGYRQVGKYYKGDRVEIFEIEAVGTNEWGRTEDGWICLTDYTELEYVEEGPHTQHTYGEWYIETDATCTEPGVRRRDCTVCAHSETEVISAKGHSFGAWYESIKATTTSYGQERRDCAHCGAYETRETPMLTVQTVTKVYATITADSLTVRSGAGSSYKRLGKLYTGVRVEILEQVTKNGVLWGRTFTGWIWLSGYATLETVEEEVPDQAPVVMTVTADSLTIRTNAGTSNAACGYLYTGAKVQVYETVTVKGALWARIDTGWVMYKYLK